MNTTVICPLPLLAATIPTMSSDSARPILTGVCLFASDGHVAPFIDGAVSGLSEEVAS